MKKKKIIKKRKNFSFDVDVVKGICPYCHEHTALVSIVKTYYRCGSCGEDTKQYINGCIKYLPLNLKAYEDLNGEKK